MADDEKYLVRGAQLWCDCGSHIRRLNLPASHGSYILEHPSIVKEDMTNKNVKFFGICFSETPPKGADTVRYAGGYENGQEAESVVGKQCIPELISTEWKDAHGNSVTTESYLVCSCGGCIRPISTGHEYSDD